MVAVCHAPKKDAAKPAETQENQEENFIGDFWVCFGCNKKWSRMHLEKCPVCKEKRMKEAEKKEPQLVPKVALQVIEKETQKEAQEDGFETPREEGLSKAEQERLEKYEKDYMQEQDEEMLLALSKKSTN